MLRKMEKFLHIVRCGKRLYILSDLIPHFREGEEDYIQETEKSISDHTETISMEMIPI